MCFVPLVAWLNPSLEGADAEFNGGVGLGIVWHDLQTRQAEEMIMAKQRAERHNRDQKDDRYTIRSYSN